MENNQKSTGGIQFLNGDPGYQSYTKTNTYVLAIQMMNYNHSTAVSKIITA